MEEAGYSMFQSPIGTNKTWMMYWMLPTTIAFQSPIGTNKTCQQLFFLLLQQEEEFQSPIGTNKTLENSHAHLEYSFVSIPYRYKQNSMCL